MPGREYVIPLHLIYSTRSWEFRAPFDGSIKLGDPALSHLMLEQVGEKRAKTVPILNVRIVDTEGLTFIALCE